MALRVGYVGLSLDARDHLEGARKGIFESWTLSEGVGGERFTAALWCVMDVLSFAGIRVTTNLELERTRGI